MLKQAGVVAVAAAMTAALLVSGGLGSGPAGRAGAQGRHALGPGSSSAFGDSTDRPASEPPARGRWYARRSPPTPSLPLEQQAQLLKLKSLGYVGGSQAPRTDQVITVFQRDRAFAGYNFHTTGKAPEAFLRDMDGNILHQWQYDFHKIWPDREIEPDQHHWRRAYLYENGDVLAIFENLGIIKIDKDSRLIWADAIAAHHDLEVMPDGDIYVLTRGARLVPEVDSREPVVDDYITLLRGDGTEKQSVSLIECFLNSPYKDLLQEREKQTPDVFHTNTLEMLDGRFAGRAPWLRAGNVLVSLRNLSVIATVDPVHRTVPVARHGLFRAQHDPKMLPNGNILLFDNKGLRNQSRVLELDPVSLEVVWEYAGTVEHPFFSDCCGLADRLPNGNTLIVESTYGRAFEVTPDKQIVWEFYNPDRAGPNGQFIAALMELTRLPLDFPLDWLSRSSP